MTAPTAAMVVIGDEILSGRIREGNAHHLAGVLSEHRHPVRGDPGRVGRRTGHRRGGQCAAGAG